MNIWSRERGYRIKVDFKIGEEVLLKWDGSGFFCESIFWVWGVVCVGGVVCVRGVVWEKYVVFVFYNIIFVLVLLIRCVV